MNFGVVGQSGQAARSPLLNAKNDGRDERGQLGRSLELQALQDWNAGVGGDAHVAENSRSDVLDPLIRCAFEHFDQRRDRVAPEPLQSLLGFRDRPGIAAPELTSPGPRFRGVRPLLQAAGIPDGWRAPGPGPLVRAVTACAERQRYAKARKQADSETVGSGHRAPHSRRRVAPGARPVLTLWRRPRTRPQAFDLAAGRRPPSRIDFMRRDVSRVACLALAVGAIVTLGCGRNAPPAPQATRIATIDAGGPAGGYVEALALAPN